MYKWFIVGLLISAQAQAADLVQIFRDAQISDPIYSSERYALAAGREKLPQARAGLLPAVSVDGNYSHNHGDANLSGTGRPYEWNAKGYTLALAQPLFRAENWENSQQSKLFVAVDEINFEKARQDLILRVCQAYFAVLAEQDALDSVRMQKNAISEQLAAAQRNFDLGNTTVTDIQEVQSRFELAVANEIAEASNLDIKRSALQHIIGKSEGVLATLRADVHLPGPQPVDMQVWVDGALSQNYAIVEQQLRLEIAQREISKARAGHLPTVDLVLSHNNNNQSADSPTLSGGTSKTNAIGIMVHIPIYSGSYVSSKVSEALAFQSKADSDLELARRNAVQDIRSAYFGVTSGLARVKALEAAQASSQMALESNVLAYRVGMRINIDVLNAQQQLYTTRSTLFQARYDTIMSSLRLKAATGSLQEDDLMQVNGLLQH